MIDHLLLTKHIEYLITKGLQQLKEKDLVGATLTFDKISVMVWQFKNLTEQLKVE